MILRNIQAAKFLFRTIWIILGGITLILGEMYQNIITI